MSFADFAAAVGEHRPRVAVVLGSGLGAAPHRFEEIASVAFGEVPGFIAPSVHGHSGRTALGLCAGRPLLVFRGRLHFYEGYPWDQIAAPLRAAADWGVRVLLLTNAAGGIRGALGPGELMVLRDHLFLQRPDAWRESVDSRPAPYSSRLVELLQTIESERGRHLPAGVYAAVTGPCYETPAEIRALRAMGADAVGMSTAFEAVTAVECGMEVAAISCITNKAAGLSRGPLDHAEVLANARRPAERVSDLLEAFVGRC
jgi:purine-nucleoside phosphorylase